MYGNVTGMSAYFFFLSLKRRLGVKVLYSSAFVGLLFGFMGLLVWQQDSANKRKKNKTKKRADRDEIFREGGCPWVRDQHILVVDRVRLADVRVDQERVSDKEVDRSRRMGEDYE